MAASVCYGIASSAPHSARMPSARARASRVANNGCLSVRVTDDGVGSPPLATCVVSVLTGLRFNPQPYRVTVRVPLAFAPPDTSQSEEDGGGD